jgi:hypothetical protein
MKKKGFTAEQIIGKLRVLFAMLRSKSDFRREVVEV